jgi:hypothetical protein
MLMLQLQLLRDIAYGGLELVAPCLAACINRPQVVSKLWYRLCE